MEVVSRFLKIYLTLFQSLRTLLIRTKGVNETVKESEAPVIQRLPDRRKSQKEHDTPAPDQAKESQDIGPNPCHPDDPRDRDQSQSPIQGKAPEGSPHSTDGEVDPGQDHKGPDLVQPEKADIHGPGLGLGEVDQGKPKLF